jgi:hypothetical protein
MVVKAAYNTCRGLLQGLFFLKFRLTAFGSVVRFRGSKGHNCRAFQGSLRVCLTGNSVTVYYVGNSLSIVLS